ncbi:putative DNA (exogenous) processing protein [Crenothrix polyspora]|uniref:Ribosomal RNA large subunit methyltransferase J n=1 Tax=Crenothrix polyspora TaxID=360316 RepID=A0A1R4H0R5_9GAMM|nr:23S rRNA (adenine(2030)-N(6))-methyltransferase RlmJ [Crenothrix polyspora]SJM89821.1 putative DNA (exogenous) processing protein [Crenothrix polyspora]
MLSYRHIFHAGNFADVLKHLVLIHIIDYLKKKDKPFCYIDTHAGPGKYPLDNEFALKNREFDSGISQLWHRDDLPELVARYVDLVKQFNDTGDLKSYPGSPLIAQHLLRKQDHLFLCELHSTEIALLTKRFKGIRGVDVVHADGLKHGLSLLPPSQHRGLVMIDPSYEIKNDYRLVVDTLLAMTKRFATGTYALWYPVIERDRNHRLEKAIIATGIKNVQLFELGVRADSSGHGMTASGMIVINPPWTLAAQMEQTLPYLAKVLTDKADGIYRIKVLAGE